MSVSYHSASGSPSPRKGRLPERHQDELIRGTKYALLHIDGDGRPCFKGTAG